MLPILDLIVNIIGGDLNDQLISTRISLWIGDNSMSTLGPIIGPWQWEEYLLIRRNHLFPKLLLSIRILCSTHNNLIRFVIYRCSLVHFNTHKILKKNYITMETLPLLWTICGPVVDPRVGML